MMREIPAEGGPLAYRLEQVCSGCDGTAIVASEAWEEWGRQREQLSQRRSRADGAALLVELLDTLLTEHDDRQPTHPRQVPCEDCHGNGAVPTVEGEEVLAFLSRHLHPDSAQIARQQGHRTGLVVGSRACTYWARGARPLASALDGKGIWRCRQPTRA